MKKILFICSIFAPNTAIGAIRSTKFAKYLALSEKYEITVIKEKKDDQVIDLRLKNDIEFLSNYYEVDCGKKAMKYTRFVDKLMNTKVYHSYSIGKNSRTKQKEKKREKLRKFVARQIIDRMHKLKEIGFAKNVIKLVKDSNLEFDFIYSSFGPMANHYAAYKLCERNSCIKWIADYRDPVRFKDKTIFLSNFFRKTHIKTLRRANKIICCSTGCFDKLFKKSNRNIDIITNGYDLADRIEIEKIESKKMHFCYCGQLYLNKSDFSSLFRCLRELIDEKLVDVNNVIIDYAGSSSSEFIFQLSKYNLNGILNNHNFISREKAINYQLNSDILLLASWNTHDEKGILTGKFLEYMMIKKPIIAIITGNEPNSSIKQMIMDGNLGICCEESNINVDYQELKKFVFEKYNEFMKNGELRINFNEEYVEKFNYRYLTDKLIDVIESC